MSKNEASIVEEIRGNISFILPHQSHLCVWVKIYYTSTSNYVKSFQFQATSERPLMTECFCPNWNLRDLAGKDKVKDNTIIFTNVNSGNTKLHFPTCTSMASTLKQLYNHYGQQKGLNLLLTLPPSAEQ